MSRRCTSGALTQARNRGARTESPGGNTVGAFASQTAALSDVVGWAAPRRAKEAPTDWARPGKGGWDDGNFPPLTDMNMVKE